MVSDDNTGDGGDLVDLFTTANLITPQRLFLMRQTTTINQVFLCLD
jgi:hypothetical protein